MFLLCNIFIFNELQRSFLRKREISERKREISEKKREISFFFRNEKKKTRVFFVVLYILFCGKYSSVWQRKTKKKRDIILSQDNALTTARYKFDLIENVPHIASFAIYGQTISNKRTDKELCLKNLIITIKEEELQKCGDNTKMKNIYDALKAA